MQAGSSWIGCICVEKFIDDRDSIPKLGSEVISCVITAGPFRFFCQPIAMALSMPVDPFAVEDPSELTDWRLPLSFMKSRHTEKIEGDQIPEESWRMKDRMKTWSVALVLCLNIGVDPPDVVKTEPCARKECWIDPLSMNSQKALEQVGNNLQRQYERWQPRARYKQLLDPTTEDARKLCIALRKNAKTERVLFHYNGHGVPKPTANGEIWVFNKNYTQYIPLSLYDLQAWMGSPSIYIFDCSNAGLVLDSFKAFARQRDSEFFLENTTQMHYVGLLDTCILMAACGAKEMLPMNPHLPADLFTACLTTPIKTALLWFCYSKPSLVKGIKPDVIDKIPGRLNDRRTPLGELNWIFTAITDTIAWNSLSREVFQKLFRQDLLVASLFRNFLLAERIMRSYNCTPECHPCLPPTYHHPMWQAWDLALDHIMGQLPALLEGKATYEPSQFFAQQLTAFQVWLINCSGVQQPPEQLPIVLQFLLSQSHRLQALELLGRFLDLGPWAVHSALSVGIFPYVLKLLGSKLRELQPILVFIWAKILSVDPSCQTDLVKDGGYKYFIQILKDPTMQYEYRTMAVFVLSIIVNKYPKGQEACYQNNVISICLEQLEEPNAVLKQWLAICLGRLWRKCDDARWRGVRDSAHEKLYNLLWDEVPDVRAAAVFALGTYVLNKAGGEGDDDHTSSINRSVGMTLLNVLHDGSPVVRKELVAALHGLILLYEKQFQIAALQTTESERMSSNLSTSITPTGWIHVSIEPPEDETSFEGKSPSSSSSQTPSRAFETSGTTSRPSHPKNSLTNGSLDHPDPHSSVTSSTAVTHGSVSSYASTVGENRFLDSLPPKKSSSQSSGGQKKTVFYHIWKGVVLLASDPSQEVAEVAQYVVRSVYDKLRQKSHAKSIGVTLVNSYSPTSYSLSKDVPTGAKAATLAGPGVRAARAHHVLSSSSSTNEFRTPRPDISLPLPHSHNFTKKRTVFGKGPMELGEEEDDESSEDLSQDLCPVETLFCDWCCKYFANSLMKQPEECDPASMSYQQREYRFIRNHLIRDEANKLCVAQAKNKLSDQIFVNKESKAPQLLKFHPYRPHLAVIHKNSWSIWDIEHANKLVTQHNDACSFGKMTAVEFINPHDITFLLTGSDDGVVHVWRDYCAEVGENPVLVTAWRALTDMLSASRNAGMVLEWEQSTGLLYAAGDVRHIRVWDTHKEMKIQDIPTGADSCVTCLTSDSADRSLMIAGCGDGTVRMYDRRQPPSSSLVQTLREHSSWIVNVFIQQHSQDRNIVSCSVGGDVRIWDPRFTKSVHSFNVVPSSLNVCEIHPRAPLLGCASPQHAIRIYNLDTEEMLNNIRYHDGFMGQRIGPTKCLAFHPFKIWLAAGGTDGLIAIYSTERRK